MSKLKPTDCIPPLKGRDPDEVLADLEKPKRSGKDKGK
jgi:hypothetical protein